MKIYWLALVTIIIGFGCSAQSPSPSKKVIMNDKSKNPVYNTADTSKVVLSNEEWKKILSPEVFRVAREKGTERPWTSKFEASTEVGTYYCAACGNALFKSDTKFESGCGWPSFYEPIS